MNTILQNINNALHVEIVVEEKDLLVASALYTYVLTLHKKVSLVCEDKEIDLKFSFMPWFDKIKHTDTPSADYTLKLNSSALELYTLLSELNIKINKKMATALYGAILDETEGFVNSRVNGTFFAISSKLIECGADFKECNKFLMHRSTLGELRLKSIMLKDMILINSAKAALFCVDSDDFKSTTTDEKDALKIMLEAFKLPYVDVAILLDRDNEVIKIVIKEI